MESRRSNGKLESSYPPIFLTTHGERFKNGLKLLSKFTDCFDVKPYSLLDTILEHQVKVRSIAW